ncbi:lipase [Micromonospora sp. NPDC050495]|uniref:PGAP1-like alpha/beta domain-containing protein n=1 Tax=Micromonospora sp. NPDC050495 TaxID=3154936 RepID=UPI0033E27B18
MRLGTRAVAMAACAATALAVSAPARATEGNAVSHRTGSPLSVPADRLAASLTCSPGVTHARRAPVLLLASTALNTGENYAWNWQRTLTREGIPWCASDPAGSEWANHNMEDIQVRAEYVVYAIRTMNRLSGHRVSVMGHSQGGMVARWALRFWPDTRQRVDDVIGLAPTNHGTALGTALCADYCAPAGWQQRVGSRFYAALNSGQETFPGISYTVIRSDADPLVPPETADLTGPGRIANVRLQDRCPGDTSDHLTVGTIDPVAEAVALDALRHPGPARWQRVDPAVCERTLMTGIDPRTFPDDVARMGGVFNHYFDTAPKVTAEPPLAWYASSAAGSGS